MDENKSKLTKLLHRDDLQADIDRSIDRRMGELFPGLKIERSLTVETETIDKLFLELSQFTQAKTAKELDLAMLVRRLVRRLEKNRTAENHAAIDGLVNQSKDYLERKGFGSEILRAEE